MMESKNFFTFCENDFSSAAFVVFTNMRKTGQLCDVVVKVQNRAFSAHRVILAGRIPYLLSLLAESGVEDAEKEITLPDDLCPAALESLIQYIYTGKVDISVENVRALLYASHIIQLEQVSDACIEFLSKNLQINDITQVRSLAHNLGSEKLAESCTQYIKKFFVEFSKTDDFVTLSHSCVKDVISGEDLCVQNEEIVFEALMKWVKASPSERQEVLPELFSEVRLSNLPIEYLIGKVAVEELVRISKPCMDLIDDVKSYHLMVNCRSFCHLKTQPRDCNLMIRKQSKREPMKHGLYAICVEENCAVVYYRDQESWCSVASNKQNDPFITAVVSNQKIYMFLARTVQVFCMQTKKWDVLGTNYTKSVKVVPMSFNNFIYYFPAEFSGRVCCFDTEQNRWLQNFEWKWPSEGSATCLLDGSIYKTGGIVYNSSGYGVWGRTAEKYDPRASKGSEISPMLETRGRHGCTSLNGKIYVCGGISEANVVSSITEEYDPLTNCWNYISSMNAARSFISLVPHGGKIYAFPNSGDSSEVDVYDAEETKMWSNAFNVPKEFKCAVSVASQ